MLRRQHAILVALLLLTAVVGFASLFLGRYPISPGTMLRVLISPLVPVEASWEPTVETVVFNIRLPRVLLAMCIGASLSVSGAAFQGMFQNPLVSPDILGVTAGAGFGAALGILLSGSAIVIQLSALAVGILAVVLTYLISRVYRTTPTLMLVLSGIVVGSIFGALLSLAKYVADPQEKLPAIVFWLMGSLATVSRPDVAYAAPASGQGKGTLRVRPWRGNGMAMGED